MSEQTAEAIPEQDFAAETFDDISRAGAEPIEDVPATATVDRGDTPTAEPETLETAPPEPTVEETPNEAETATSEAETATGEKEPTSENAVESETEAEAPQKPFQIPKSRLDKEIARKKALQNQVEDLQRQLDANKHTPGQQTEFVFEAGDDPKKMFDKVLEGDLDTANTLFSDMVTKAVQAGIQTATANIDSRVADQVQSVNRAQTEAEVAEELENSYEIFRVDSEEYDDALVGETLAIRDSFVARGYEPADAMRQAADYVIKVNKPELLQEQTTETAPPQQTRNPQAVEKNVAAANQQPPSLPTSTQGSKAPPEVDISNLSDEEFAALPQATLARLRGDIL
jgi:hypothetical protein